MRIRSRFKDYYDYVEKQHGGDPNTVYNRETIADPEPNPWPAYRGGGNQNQRFIDANNMGFTIPQPLYHESLGLPSESERNLKEGEVKESYTGLAVAGKLYYLMQLIVGVRDESLGYLSIKAHVKLPLHAVERLDIRSSYSWVKAERYVSGKELPACVKLHKWLKAPVFMFNEHNCKIVIFEKVPSLGDLRLAALVPAEQLYQELAMFMGKMYTDNPDTMPKVPMTDVQKVESHGFDKKQSFRHRK